MFSSYHFVWLAICALLTVVGTVLLKRYKPSLTTVLTIACAVCVWSELTKVFSTMRLVPSSDGTMLYPYLELQHLPFHLCSLQIVCIFMARFMREGRKKETLLAFMYPTCLIGAIFALLLPSIFSTSIDVTQAFTHPLAYQTFLYHTMLILLALYIPMSGQVQIRAKHYFSTMGLLFSISFLSLYVNSLFASPTYRNGTLVSVDYTTNFFFTYKPPIPVVITEMWQWYLYFAILFLLAIVLVGALYLPYFIRERGARRTQ